MTELRFLQYIDSLGIQKKNLENSTFASFVAKF